MTLGWQAGKKTTYTVGPIGEILLQFEGVVLEDDGPNVLGPSSTGSCHGESLEGLGHAWRLEEVLACSLLMAE